VSAIDISPQAVVEASSKRVLAEFVKDLASTKGRDLAEIRTKRLRLRNRLIVAVGKAKTRDRLAVIASATIYSDLIDQGWRLKVDRQGRFLGSRPTDDDDELRAHKRGRFQAAREAQLRQPATRTFVERMERGATSNSSRQSIYSLMRDGRHLQQEIDGAMAGTTGKTLAQVVQPYMQFVDPTASCSITGIPLQDIWRYFRHTWSNPYESVPGRSMLFLVRDGAAANHPVIGIGAISSAAVQLDARDRYIGWLGENVLAQCLEQPSEEYTDWILATLDRALKTIYRQDFLEKGILPARLTKQIPEQSIARLRKLAARAREQHYLRAEAKLNKAGGNAVGVTGADWLRYARSPLFIHKRAREIASLLEVRNLVWAAFDAVPKTERLAALLSSTAGRAAFLKVVRIARSITVGTEIADLTVCGAVPPYNTILGGKLVAMLATSPEVVLEYKRRYQATPSIIASSMAGRAIIRPANLVFVGTTSLYGERPNQYDRASYPCEIVGGPRGEVVKYRYLTSPERTRTAGVGTFQFGRDTKAAIEKFISSTTNGRRVNNVFGEGTSPKLRSLRDGLNALGINSNEMLEHGMEKVVYGVALASNVYRYLLRLDDQPEYLFSLDRPAECTASIARHWFERWASARFGREEISAKLMEQTLVRPIRHGARVLMPETDDETFRHAIE